MAAPITFHEGRYNGRTLREWLPELVERLVADSAPLRVVVFGSVAAGTEDEDSDLDLLVVLPHVEDKAEATLELRRALRDIPVPLDVIPTDPEEIDRRGDAVGSVLREALRHGEVVYERPG